MVRGRALEASTFEPFSHWVLICNMHQIQMVSTGMCPENFHFRGVLTLETHHSMRPISLEDLHWFGREMNKQRGKGQICINCCMWSKPLGSMGDQTCAG
mmetsp:Transcript_82927/g.160262  ORF Transcript_82927/g.160262 Transcript_82927/m.160262 type:complete len:99 (+) Transcript_82927:94-390(+)